MGDMRDQRQLGAGSLMTPAHETRIKSLQKVDHLVRVGDVAANCCVQRSLNAFTLSLTKWQPIN